MKILNLFCGIGGNRTLWGDKHQITAVESEKPIADFYKKQFPNDEVIIGDAYDYLELNFINFDFIWASPPCQSHTTLSRLRAGRRYNKTYANDRIKVPDMRLYGLILFLQHLFRGDWVVENVKAFYEPLIKPTTIIGRHWIWSNIKIPSLNKKKKEHFNNWKKECVVKGLDVNRIKKADFITRKDVVVHNCVSSKLGKYILNQVTYKGTKGLEVFL